MMWRKRGCRRDPIKPDLELKDGPLLSWDAEAEELLKFHSTEDMCGGWAQARPARPDITWQQQQEEQTLPNFSGASDFNMS